MGFFNGLPSESEVSALLHYIAAPSGTKYPSDSLCELDRHIADLAGKIQRASMPGVKALLRRDLDLLLDARPVVAVLDRSY